MKTGSSIRHHSPPREVHRRCSRLGKVDIVARGGTPAGATPGRVPPRSRHLARSSRIRRHVRSSKIHHRRAPLGPLPVLPKPTASRATAVTTGPRVRCHRSSSLGASSALACPHQERRCRPPASTRHRRWPLGSSSLARPKKPPTPLARPREPSPSLKANLWRPGVFL
jgi:hypothetical protein